MSKKGIIIIIIIIIGAAGLGIGYISITQQGQINPLVFLVQFLGEDEEEEQVKESAYWCKHNVLTYTNPPNSWVTINDLTISFTLNQSGLIRAELNIGENNVNFPGPGIIRIRILFDGIPYWRYWEGDDTGDFPPYILAYNTTLSQGPHSITVEINGSDAGINVTHSSLLVRFYPYTEGEEGINYWCKYLDNIYTNPTDTWITLDELNITTIQTGFIRADFGKILYFPGPTDQIFIRFLVDGKIQKEYNAMGNDYWACWMLYNTTLSPGLHTIALQINGTNAGICLYNSALLIRYYNYSAFQEGQRTYSSKYNESTYTNPSGTWISVDSLNINFTISQQGLVRAELVYDLIFPGTGDIYISLLIDGVTNITRDPTWDDYFFRNHFAYNASLSMGLHNVTVRIKGDNIGICISKASLLVAFYPYT